ncbi:MAG: NDP-sugar synthase [Candidatus Melainabacteria bacterium]
MTTARQAIILAGGQGTRLKPYTTLLPKALVPLDTMPVLELVLRQLKMAGFERITLAVGHLAELIEAFFGNGEKLGLTITYAREDQPLGTAGPLKALENELDDHFLVMNADIVSDINYRLLFEHHVSRAAEAAAPVATVAVYRRTSRIDFGILEYDEKTRAIQNFVEKPTLHHSVSMGVYVFSKNVCEFIPESTFFGFDTLMHTLIQQKQPIQAFPFDGYWLDIGRVDDYETAVNDFQTMRDKLLPDPETHTHDAVVGLMGS